MKRLFFKGTSLDDIREFPTSIRREIGYQLSNVQQGFVPSDWKPMPSIGKGVREIRVRDQTGAYRIIYIAKLKNAIYVLTAFQKKQEIEKAKFHYTELIK